MAIFLCFLVKSFLVARSYLVVVINNKILILGAVDILDTSLKIPMVLDDFGNFSNCFLWYKYLSLGH